MLAEIVLYVILGMKDTSRNWQKRRWVCFEWNVLSFK